MFKIIIEKECSCFKKSGLKNNIEINSKNEASMRTLEMRNYMNNKFCGKHNFRVEEVEDSFIIIMNNSASNRCRAES